MKMKQHGIAGALGVRKPSTVPLKVGGAFNYKQKPQECEGEEDGWENLPKGWTSNSRDQFAKSIGTESEEGHPFEGMVDTCMDKIAGHVDDPGAFCASLHDQVTGTTSWRGKGK